MSKAGTTCLCFVILLFLPRDPLFAQFGPDTHRPVFENRDFKIFHLSGPEVVPSVSGDANFGVLVLLGESATWGTPGTKCGFCFTGPTGRQNLLVFGTPAGVVPLAEEHAKPNQRFIWVAVRPDAEITELLFKKALPEEFQDAVRDDLFSIGYLADRVSTGAKPSEVEQGRASAGLNDLIFKSDWFSRFEGSTEIPPPLIHVKVHTRRSGKEINDWTVWYVLDGWHGDRDHTYSFDKESSPTEQLIPPGIYWMWATRKRKQGPGKRVLVGDTPNLTKELDLEVP